uniref:Putative rho GTPase-activating protein 1 n=1 Tax=Davidia involucrata TaxID=16924 RepID=A0A5B7AZP3_DAVIN
MTEVLHSSPSSSSSSLSCTASPGPTHNDALFQTQSFVEEEEEGDSRVSDVEEVKERDKDRDQLSLLALLVTLFRKSFWGACKTDREELCGMEIGWPTNVRHVAHVTFDRFNGFLGLPVEFEPEVPRRAPSASTTVFGVSTESMQLSYDLRGNSVPTILLLMQSHLYVQGGLQAEGIFRINAENSQEEYIRDQLNRGVVPGGIDVHCLAGLIKAWFRELPTGVLDSLSPEQVLQCQSEDDCAVLARLLPPTEAALLDWAINLMADVVQQEHLNKMNGRNIAMVFAPNMTQMADPLTVLMYAVQVMNFLKTLIVKTLQEREDPVVEPAPVSRLEPSDESRHQSPSQLCVEDTAQNEETKPAFSAEEAVSESASDSNELDDITDGEACSDSTSIEEPHGGCETPTQVDTFISETAVVLVSNGPKTQVEENNLVGKIGQSSDSNLSKDPGEIDGQQPVVQVMGPIEKGYINSRTQRIEALAVKEDQQCWTPTDSMMW